MNVLFRIRNGKSTIGFCRHNDYIRRACAIRAVNELYWSLLEGLDGSDIVHKSTENPFVIILDRVVLVDVVDNLKAASVRVRVRSSYTQYNSVITPTDYIIVVVAIIIAAVIVVVNFVAVECPMMAADFDLFVSSGALNSG